MAGLMAKTLRFRGVKVASTDPVLLGWLSDGFDEARVLEALEVVRQYKPAPELVPAAYLDKVLRNPQRGGGNGRQTADWNAAREQRAAALTGRGAAAGGEVIEGEFGQA